VRDGARGSTSEGQLKSLAGQIRGVQECAEASGPALRAGWTGGSPILRM